MVLLLCQVNFNALCWLSHMIPVHPFWYAALCNFNPSESLQVKWTSATCIVTTLDVEKYTYHKWPYVVWLLTSTFIYLLKYLLLVKSKHWVFHWYKNSAPLWKVHVYTIDKKLKWIILIHEQRNYHIDCIHIVLHRHYTLSQVILTRAFPWMTKWSSKLPLTSSIFIIF